MALYGNAGSLSSLLSAASAARKRQESLQDSIASYEWDTSARTTEDYVKYSKFLQDRAKTYGETDPMRALEYQRKVNSANSSFASAEISRASNQVLYGTGSNRDKYNTIAKLYQNALEAGDENLASRLEGQAARLSITIQNELDAAARSAGAAGERARAQIAKNYDAKYKEFDSDIRELDAEMNKGQHSPQAYVELKSRIMEGKANFLSQAAGDPNLDPEKANKYAEDVKNIANSDQYKKLQYYKQGVAAAVGQDGQVDNNKLPFRFIKDNQTGEFKLEDRKVVGQIGAGKNPLDVFGSPQVDIGKIAKEGGSGTLDVNRNLSGEAGSDIVPIGMKVYSSKDNPNLKSAQDRLGNFAYYVDPVTGKEILVRPDNTRVPLERAIESKQEEDNAKISEDTGAGDVAMGILNPYKNGILSGLGTAALGPLGPATSALTGIISNFGRQQEINKIKAAKEEADRQKVLEENRRQAAALQANATRALAPLPVAAKATYNNGQGVKVAAPFSAMNAAAQVSKATGSAAPVVQTFLNQNPFGAANIYGKKF